ncbi:flagellar hook-basal body complex protein FliE [Roseospira navarrensis]|uniref:Flagellar hook-basal body complex protein FliE n=1 Tax=Roseospira navarrensis TaxID=140058 RepID=A0A7X1ZBA4_9PROT|nr:flagellar hook-basal body complex protein FliE [Roseospira navarrensis]MQX35223.1 flagellar hook-basal body complex protein FliE [Roseospira navarrensis]
MADVSFNSAIQAYRAASRQMSESAPQPGQMPEASAGSSSFASMVHDVVKDSIGSVREGERMSLKAVTGEADTRDVVMAANSAEITLQTVVAIRDKVISAYDTIMRMPL